MNRQAPTAPIVILGAGPSGCAAAALLSQREIPSILIDREVHSPEFDVLDKSRSYRQGLFKRGLDILKTIPDLYNQAVEECHLTTLCNSGHVSGEGIFYAKPPVGAKNRVPEVLFLNRGRFVTALRRSLQDDKFVQCLFETKVEALHFLRSGLTRVAMRNKEGVSNVDAGLIIGCDGIYSTTLKQLDEACKASEANLWTRISNKSAFGKVVKKNASVGVLAKSIVMSPTALYKLGVTREHLATSILRMSGAGRWGRKDWFNVTFHPMSDDEIKEMGGIVGAIFQPADCVLWSVKTVDEAYDAFQNNYPYLNVREVFPRDAMESFLQVRPRRFPSISHPRSLGAVVGSEKCIQGGNTGGVVLIGDAAHTFPPDLGHGMSAAFEDLKVLVNVLDEAGEDCSMGDVARRYNEARLLDVAGFVEINAAAAYTQFGQKYWWDKGRAWNMTLRRNLAARFPGYVWPSMVEMMLRGMPFREAARLGQLTTRRLRLAGGVVLFITCYSIWRIIMSIRR